MTAQPVGGDLHVDRVLTQFSVAWVQGTNDFISSKVFPRLPVDKRTDRFEVYNRGQWRTDSGVFKRAPGTESRGIQFNKTKDTYYVDPFAVHYDIDDQTLAEADDPLQLPREATQLITNRLLLHKEKDWHDNFFKSGVWATEPTPTGTDLWTDAASDPINQMAQWVDDFTLLNSKPPNTLVLGVDVWRALKNHPDLIERIKYTQRGLVGADLIGAAFEIPTILVSRASHVPGFEERGSAKTDNDNAPGFAYITNPKGLLLTYSTPSPKKMEPLAGLSVTWKGYFAGNAQGVRMKRFRMEHLESERIEGMITFQHKLVSPEMGLYVDNIIDAV